jgi:hypothetical protein
LEQHFPNKKKIENRIKQQTKEPLEAEKDNRVTLSRTEAQGDVDYILQPLDQTGRSTRS